MFCIAQTLAVLKLLKSSLVKLVQLENMYHILVTLAVLKLRKSTL